MYKKATASADVLNAKYNRTQEENQRLKEKLRRDLVALEKARDQILQLEEHNRPLVSDPQLQQKLEEAEKAKREAKIRAEKAESKNRELEAQLQSAKTEAEKCLTEKDILLQNLHQ